MPEKASILPVERSRPETELGKYRICIHGVPKSGKTSLGAQFPNALIIKTEEGTKGMSVYAYPEQGVCTEWAAVSKAIAALVKEEHTFQTVVFDTGEGLYSLLCQQVAKEAKVEHVLDLQYGRGYDKANQRLQHIFDDLESVGLGVVLICHTRLLDVNIGGVAASRAVPDLSESPRKVLLRWADLILYLHVTQEVDEETGETKHIHRAVCRPSDTIEAGGRIRHMPSEIVLSPTPREGFARMKAAFDAAIKQFVEELAAEHSDQKGEN